MKKTIIRLLTFLSTLLLLNSCKHKPDELVLNGTDTTATRNGNNNQTKNDSVCFNTQILPLIINNCATTGCHDATSRVEGLNLTNYTAIRKMVNPITMKGSLLTVTQSTGRNRMPPAPMAPMDTTAINLIKKWMGQGALNRVCTDSPCDSSNVTYRAKISTLIHTNCKGCHQSSNAGGGVNLENYNLVKTSIQSGKFMCTIYQNSGCSPMPKGGLKLSKCDIRLIEIWIENGFQE
jgi:hypothetical protein